MRRIAVDTSLTNQNISSALLTYTYTADDNRLLFIRLFADQIAGNGTYTAYVTLQRSGAGSAFRVVPRTDASVASGVTSICFTTIAFPVLNTDVVKVYLTGLAGDTTTPDIITEIWEDDALRPTTEGQHDVDTTSGGAVGVDWGNVENKTTTNALTGTSVNDVTTKTGYSLSTAGVQAIWDVLTSALTTVGSIGKLFVDNINATITSRSSHTASDVWAVGTRTLTSLSLTILTDLATVLGLTNTSIASVDAITDTYQAKVELVDDDNGTTDRYAVSWFKNGEPVSAGVTLATIQVIKTADGSDLIASSAMTLVTGTSNYYYSATGAERLVSGASYIAVVTATIDSAIREWRQPVGVDS